MPDNPENGPLPEGSNSGTPGPGNGVPRPRGGFPVQPTGGFPAHPTGGFPAQPPGGFPAQPPGPYGAQSPGPHGPQPRGGQPGHPTGGFPAQQTGGGPAQPTGGYPAQPPSGYPVPPPGGYPGQPAGGYPTNPTGGYPAQPPGPYGAPPPNRFGGPPPGGNTGAGARSAHPEPALPQSAHPQSAHPQSAHLQSAHAQSAPYSFAAPPGQPGRAKRGRWLKFGLVGLVVLLLVGAGVGVAGWQLGWFSKDKAPTMLATGDLGDDPFGQNYSEGTTPSPTQIADFRKVGDAPAGGGKTTGTARGLYGGSLDLRTCDAGAIIDYLKANDDKRIAFASVVGANPDKVEDYILGLTSVVLLRDTWVTNHGFRDGAANPFQAVLQAGTAVLVDKSGIPRVRCACGNPLGPPEEGKANPAAGGHPWDGYSGNDVVQVAGGVPQNTFDIVDLRSGQIVSAPAGIIRLNLKGTWKATANWNSDPQVSLVIPSEVRLDGELRYGGSHTSKDCVNRLAETSRSGTTIKVSATSETQRSGCAPFSATMSINDRTMQMSVTQGSANSLVFQKVSS